MLICQQCNFQWKSHLSHPTECPHCKTRRWTQLFTSSLVSIYVLEDPRNHEIFYVGATTQILKQRLAHHRSDPKNVRKQARLEAIAADQQYPIIRLVAEVSWKKADDVEQAWIRKLRDDGHPLTNRNYRIMSENP